MGRFSLLRIDGLKIAEGRCLDDSLEQVCWNRAHS
jgi:hypothetical protein